MRVGIVAGPAVVALVSGCGLVRPIAGPAPDLNVVISARDVIGDWHNTTAGGTFHFAADQTFEAHDMPAEAFRDVRSSGTARLDDRGTWRLDGDTGRVVEVAADFAGIPGVTVGAGSTLGAERQPDGRTGLVLLVRNTKRFPDGRYVLTRP